MFLLPIVLGVLIGYFLSFWVVIGVTAFVAYRCYKFMKPSQHRRGGGDVGVLFMGVPFVVLLFLSMWITWFFAPGSMGWSFDPSPALEFLRILLLK